MIAWIFASSRWRVSQSLMLWLTKTIVQAFLVQVQLLLLKEKLLWETLLCRHQDVNFWSVKCCKGFNILVWPCIINSPGHKVLFCFLSKNCSLTCWYLRLSWSTKSIGCLNYRLLLGDYPEIVNGLLKLVVDSNCFRTSPIDHWRTWPGRCMSTCTPLIGSERLLEDFTWVKCCFNFAELTPRVKPKQNMVNIANWNLLDVDISAWSISSVKYRLGFKNRFGLSFYIVKAWSLLKCSDHWMSTCMMLKRCMHLGETTVILMNVGVTTSTIRVIFLTFSSSSKVELRSRKSCSWPSKIGEEWLRFVSIEANHSCTSCCTLGPNFIVAHVYICYINK